MFRSKKNSATVKSSGSESDKKLKKSEEEEDFSCSAEDYVSLDSLLFYTPKIVEAIDDKEVFRYVNYVWPQFDEAENEKEERKTFLQFLLDVEKVQSILDRYHYTMMDLISLFYRKKAYLFTTKTYIEKVRDIIADNYADAED